VSVLHP